MVDQDFKGTVKDFRKGRRKEGRGKGRDGPREQGLCQKFLADLEQWLCPSWPADGAQYTI